MENIQKINLCVSVTPLALPGTERQDGVHPGQVCGKKGYRFT
jgi:hypothetical protein